MDFAPDKKRFAACGNETGIKVWDISDSTNTCVVNMAAAHADNIKKVLFLSDQTLLSASSDKRVKLWDLRKPDKAVTTLTLANPIEDFCLAGENIFVAHGNALNKSPLDLTQQKDFFAFQKPIMRVRYDPIKGRVLAAGLDSMLKVLEEGEEALKVVYKVKMPSEVFALDMAPNGNHFAMGLNDGSLLIKSKMLEVKTEELEADEKLFAMFRPKFESKSKNYKYFFRGQYEVVADNEDLITGAKGRKKRLQPYETHLKKFEYKLALNAALRSGNPEVVLSLIEELTERKGLHIALGNRNEGELLELVQFLIWKIADHRYSDLLVEVASVLLDMYLGVFGLSPAIDNALFVELKQAVADQIHLAQGLS